MIFSNLSKTEQTVLKYAIDHKYLLKSDKKLDYNILHHVKPSLKKRVILEEYKSRHQDFSLRVYLDVIYQLDRIIKLNYLIKISSK